jgi:hypothetical protein
MAADSGATDAAGLAERCCGPLVSDDQTRLNMPACSTHVAVSQSRESMHPEPEQTPVVTRHESGERYRGWC